VISLSIRKVALSLCFALFSLVFYSPATFAQVAGDSGEATSDAKLLAQQASEQQSLVQVSPTRDYAENYVFADPQQRKQFLELTAELRCPKCQNQNIADSDAPIAHDMRRKVYELMQEGNEKPEVIDWMKQRYGDFVYYQPPVTLVTVWLWLLPVLFALVMLLVFVKRRKIAMSTDTNQEEFNAKLARANKLLKDES